MAIKKSKKNTRKQKLSNKRVGNFRILRIPGIWRFARWGIILLCILAITPILLTAIYRLEAVRPISTLMIADYVSGLPVKREWLALDGMSDNLKRSVTMSEDGKFCTHDGIDWAALNTVVESALEGERTRGASTITMQTVKNLFLWGGRSYLRKALEIPLAIMFDFMVPKRRILEIYLNIAEWDTGIYGANSAARTYFKKSGESLTRRQAALLTVTLPNPRGRNAAKPTKRMNTIATIVEKRARNAKAYIQCIL